MAFRMLQECRNYRCGWLNSENEEVCPNCGCRTPSKGLHHQRKQEFERLDKIVARADEGLPNISDDAGGCIYAPIAVTIGIVFFANEIVERGEGCGGFLKYVLLTVVTSAVLGLIAFYVVSEIVKAPRSRAAEEVMSRWRELRDMLGEDEEHSFRSTEKIDLHIVSQADERLNKIYLALQELRRTERSDEANLTKIALAQSTTPWLEKKQQALSNLRFIESMRWRNTLGNLHPLRLGISRASLEELRVLIQKIEDRIDRGTRLVRRISDELWPCYSDFMVDSLSGLLTDCRVVEEALRKRTIQIVLVDEEREPDLLPLPGNQSSLFQTEVPDPSVVTPRLPDSVRSSLESALSKGLPPPRAHSDQLLRTDVKTWEKDVAKLFQAIGE